MTEALLTYVAIDGEGKPQALPENAQIAAWRQAIQRNADSALASKA